MNSVVLVEGLAIMAAETLEENKIWDLGTDRGIKANAVN
jgi:hypothetical protein